MKPLVVRPRADKDTDNYYCRIKQDNQSAALRFLDAVQATFERIRSFPAIGSLRYHQLPLFETVRVIAVSNFSNYQIFYIERDNHIEVIRIIHSSMNISEEMLNFVD